MPYISNFLSGCASDPAIPCTGEAEEYRQDTRSDKKLNVKSVLLVTDSTLCKTDIASRLVSHLTENGISCAIYDGVNPNPTVHNVEEAFKVYRKHGAKSIIAFGGGSPMDCAKAVGARAAYPKKGINKMKGLL